MQRRGVIAETLSRGQEWLGVLALEPFCQAEVPAAAAVLACAHFCRASSLGGTS
ncbi:MAG: hypothetical protein JWO75_722, partial [Actinomycetia bacterium]|nr:hypothetical protein [Actinomycetes bacterium]